MQGDVVLNITKIAQEAIEAGRRIVSVDGVAYYAANDGGLRHLPPVPFAPARPEPKALVVHTLDALIGYLQSDATFDQAKTRDEVSLAIHIVSPSRVDLISSLIGDQEQRLTFVAAQLVDRLDGFKFGQWYAREEMNIALQTRFVAAGDRAEVLKLVGTLADDTKVVFADDGVTQKVDVKAGITLVDATSIRNPYNLAPFRTFPEVTQPDSPFVLRVRSTPQGPQVALFEADGGEWRMDAISGIRHYLTAAALDIPIIG